MLVSALLITWLSAPVTVQKDVPASSSSIQPAKDVVQTDIRLQRLITVENSDVTLDVILASISKQTGVPLKVRRANSIGQSKINILMRNVPASDVLSSLANLFSYKNYSCRWEVPLADQNAYTLNQSGDFLPVAKAARAKVRRDFFRDVEKARSLIGKSAEEIRATPDRGRIGDSLLGHLSRGNKRYVNLLNAFYNGLSASQQKDVLSGREVIVAYGSGNKAIDDLIDEELSHVSSENKVRNESESKATFRVDPYTYNAELAIGVDNGVYGNVIGNTADPTRDLGVNWHTRLDEVSDPKEDSVVKPPDAGDAEKIEDEKVKPGETDAQALSRLMRSLGRSHDIGIIALLPARDPRVSQTFYYPDPLPTQESPYGKTVKRLLDRFDRKPFLFQYKWHKGILLMRDPAVPFLEALSEYEKRNKMGVLPQTNSL